MSRHSLGEHGPRWFPHIGIDASTLLAMGLSTTVSLTEQHFMDLRTSQHPHSSAHIFHSFDTSGLLQNNHPFQSSQNPFSFIPVPSSSHIPTPIPPSSHIPTSFHASALQHPLFPPSLVYTYHSNTPLLFHFNSIAQSPVFLHSFSVQNF